MQRIIEEPTVTQETGYGNDRATITTHPAYGQIGASRITGRTNLYGSDFQHQNYIRVRIAKSEMHRNISTDWPSANSLPYIEVDLSEAQWASFVSSMNVGQGTLCTVRSVGINQLPELPDPPSREKQFYGEVRETMQEAIDNINKLRAEVNESKMPQKQKDAILGHCRMIEMRIGSSVSYVLDQFGEHMENTVEKAKIEINAYVTNTVMRTGIAALTDGDDQLPVLTFSGSKP